MQIITNQSQKETKPHGQPGFPILVSHEQLSHYESGSFLWHWHPELEFTIVTDGQISYQINQQTFEATKGQVLFCNANALHTGHMIDGQDCQYLSITLDAKMIYGFHSSTLREKYVDPITQNFTLSGLFFDMSQPWHLTILQHLKKIVSLYEKQSSMYELEITVELHKLWETLFLHCQDTLATSTVEQTSYQRVLSIMHYIELHYMEKVTLQSISDLLHLSECECSRLFKRYMNTTLFSFLQKYRIERSVELLSRTDLSITEIAIQSGFSDSNYFTKTFVKHMCCTPRDYRKHANQSKIVSTLEAFP